MSDEHFDEDALLAATRRVLTPTPEQADRVLQTMRATLAGGAATSAMGAMTPAPARAAPEASLARAWLPNAIGAVSIAVVSGVVGYQLGLHTSERRAAEADAVAAVATPAPITTPAPAAPLEPNDPNDPVDVSAPPQPSTPTEPAARAQPSQRPGPTRTASNAGETGSSSMQEEIDAMRRVDRALHDHDPRRALALLYQLERDVPSGKLMQEREAAFAMARCALGLGDAQQLGRDFAVRHPGSVYLARVRQTCAPDQRNEAALDTHE